MAGKPGMKREHETVADKLAVALLLELQRVAGKRLPLSVVAAKLSEVALGAGLLRSDKSPPRRVLVAVPDGGRRCSHRACWALSHDKDVPHWNGLGQFVTLNNGRARFVERWTDYSLRRRNL